MSRRMTLVACLFVASVAVNGWRQAGADTIVNIDFNGFRSGDVQGPTYSGTVLYGPAGSGTAWNGITIDSINFGDGQTVGGSGLLNSAGVATSIGISVSPVGGDVNDATTTKTTDIEALWTDYAFGNASFTITGLGSATAADIYYYCRGDQAAPVLGGVTATNLGKFADGGEAGAWYTYRAHVSVINGTITSSSNPFTVVAGMSIVVPEPSTLVLLAAGLIGLLAYAWQKRK